MGADIIGVTGWVLIFLAVYFVAESIAEFDCFMGKSGW